MKGIFWAGLALGVIAGAFAVEANPKIKQMTKDATKMIQQQTKSSK